MFKIIKPYLYKMQIDLAYPNVIDPLGNAGGG